MKHDDTVFEGIKIIDKVDDTPAANGVTQTSADVQQCQPWQCSEKMFKCSTVSLLFQFVFELYRALITFTLVKQKCISGCDKGMPEF